MTPDEIMNELELFKERVNADGKSILDRLKQELLPYLEAKEPEVKVVEKPVEVEKVVVKKPVGDRRDEERDPMESEQHKAEQLHFTSKPHRDK